MIIMNTIRLSATSARNKFFELLNQVALGTEVIIEKDKKEVAVLAPKKIKTDWVAFRKAAKAANGILRDYSVEEISPLRKKDAWKGFGEWDKDIILKDK
jgi:prevent-host-death family protein